MKRTDFNMLDIINQIRNWIFPHVDVDHSRKRKAALDNYDTAYSPKLRKFSNMSHLNDEDWPSSSSSGSVRRVSNAANGRTRATKSKENVVINLDDEDDDIMEVTPRDGGAARWTNELQRRRGAYQSTSTPFKSTLNNRNHDDLLRLKTNGSITQRKSLAQREGFDYIEPLSYLSNKSHENAEFNSVRDVKAKLYRQPSRKSSILDQSFRLDEKMRFNDLIKRSATNYTSHLMQKNLDLFSKYSAAPQGVAFRAGRGKRMVDLVAPAHNRPVEFIDLTAQTKPKLKTKDEIQRILDDFDSDSDVEIIPPAPSPKPDIQVDPVNSLRPIVDTSKNTHKDWLHDIISKHREKIAVRNEQIKLQQNQRQNLQGMSKEVHAKLLTDQFEKCLKLREDILPIEIEDTLKLPALSDADEQRVDVALARARNAGEVLVEKFNLSITRRDMQTLAGLNWLNDEVINFYMNLITERGKLREFPNCYTMNTFFYPKLVKDGHASLRRWTRRVDIFAYDILCVPIHLSVHWCMAIIDFRKARISYYDSMGNPNRKCLEALLGYLEAEHLDKKKAKFDASGWELVNMMDIPQQMNGSDCGMFSCTFAEFLSRDARINFAQEDMPYLRRKMVLEILNGQLLIS